MLTEDKFWGEKKEKRRESAGQRPSALLLLFDQSPLDQLILPTCWR